MQSEIATERCLLRAYEETDREDYVSLNTDAEVRRHMNGPLSREQAENLFQEILNRNAPQRFSWAVTDISTGNFIGQVFLVHEGEKGHEFGYMLTPDCWGRGLATEIAGAALNLIRSDPEIDRVFATADEDHAASHRVLEKSGFRPVRDDSDASGTFRVYECD